MEKVTSEFYTHKKSILQGENGEKLIIKGISVGTALPGNFATEYKVDKTTYLSWFEQIREMGANVILADDIYQSSFYQALYEFNESHETPLYLIQGIQTEDYGQFSHVDAYHEKYYGVLKKKLESAVDIIHGNAHFMLRKDAGMEDYFRDVSKWLLAYSIGMPWDSTVIAYTDRMRADEPKYQGRYLSASADATAYESLLARLGDQLFRYETEQYKVQHLLTFNSSPEQDPLSRKTTDRIFLEKCAWVDLEHIQITKNVKSGIFASYEVFLYSHYLSRTAYNGASDEIYDIIDDESISDYRKYLTVLNDHYSIPVAVSAFGASTARGMWQDGAPDYHMTEKQQGEAIIDNFKDIMEAGLSGGCVRTWQDAWYERTPNTLSAVDPERTPYWKDVQSSDQEYGLLTFEPGKEIPACVVDGDGSEWEDADLVAEGKSQKLYMRQDAGYLYFLIKQEQPDDGKSPLYIPIDITNDSGSRSFKQAEAAFERPADFLIVLDGKDNSRVLVNERYEFLRAAYGHIAYKLDPYIQPPAADSGNFVPILQYCGTSGNSSASILDAGNLENENEEGDEEVETLFGETGKLVYGNADPGAEDFCSLADFCSSGDVIEIRIPWNLLNFSDPSRMHIHGDYYANYGVVNKNVEEIFAGVGTADSEDGEIHMSGYRLEPWGNAPVYHERLKQSYEMLKEYWTGELR